jgi:hypothetical protein
MVRCPMPFRVSIAPRPRRAQPASPSGSRFSSTSSTSLRAGARRPRGGRHSLPRRRRGERRHHRHDVPRPRRRPVEGPPRRGREGEARGRHRRGARPRGDGGGAKQRAPGGLALGAGVGDRVLRAPRLRARRRSLHLGQPPAREDARSALAEIGGTFSVGGASGSGSPTHCTSPSAGTVDCADAHGTVTLTTFSPDSGLVARVRRDLRDAGGRALQPGRGHRGSSAGAEGAA